MQYKCLNCRKSFNVHPFILMRHPGNAKCPDCDGKGKLTEQGKKERSSRFQAMNQSIFGGE